MISTKLALIALISNCALGFAQELAEGRVDPTGKLENRGLTFVETARGADNFFLEDPMDSHDFTHISAVRKSLVAQMKTSSSSSTVASIEEALRPIFIAMPKDDQGHLTRGAARYALHRLFTQRHGWSIKGLQPAGAAWMISHSMLDGVKEISKFMLPSFLEELMLKELDVPGFDLHSLAILAATLEHLIHAEMIDLVYATYKTLELPIPGKRTDQQVDDILDTFMLVYTMGVNLDVSNLDDVTNAKHHLNRTHPAWPQLRAFAQEIKRSLFATGKLDFDEIVRVVEKIGDKYAEFLGKDCSQLKHELATTPSYSKGGVKLSWVSPLVVNERRELLTESQPELSKLGVLREGGTGTNGELIIPNYINSQSMCLSTASFYAACCTNECDGLLAKLEKDVRGPDATTFQLVPLLETLLQGKLQTARLQALEGLKDRTGHVSIHSHGFAQWMHEAFPLACPKPDATHDQKVSNPKTADAWIGESPTAEKQFQQMTKEIAKTLRRFTTMGTKGKQQSFHTDMVPVDNDDVLSISLSKKKKDQQGLVPSAVHLAAVASMMVLAVALVKSGLGGLRCLPMKGKKVSQDMDLKETA